MSTTTIAPTPVPSATDPAATCRFSEADMIAMYRWAPLALNAGFELEHEVDPVTGAWSYVATWAEGDQFVSILHPGLYAGLHAGPDPPGDQAAAGGVGSAEQASTANWLSWHEPAQDAVARIIQHHGTHLEVTDPANRRLGLFTTLSAALESIHPTVSVCPLPADPAT